MLGLLNITIFIKIEHVFDQAPAGVWAKTIITHTPVGLTLKNRIVKKPAPKDRSFNVLVRLDQRNRRNKPESNRLR